MLYPLFFRPIYKRTLWGGKNLQKLPGRESANENGIGESWDICCHFHGMSVIENGMFSGRALGDLITEYGTDLVGYKAMSLDRFPILVKLIDAADRLSVQVHPGNAVNNGDWGKTELQYVIHAKPDARIVYGVCPGTDKADFEQALRTGAVEEHLNYVDVKSGDCLLILPGTVHAVLDGLIIAEIQSNSDTTYRVYDWNRVDQNGMARKLHIDRALEVMDFASPLLQTPTLMVQNDDYDLVRLVRCDSFNIDKVVIRSAYHDSTDRMSFHVYTVVGGKGYLVHEGHEYSLNLGTSFLLPAALGAYELHGNLELLKTWL